MQRRIVSAGVMAVVLGLSSFATAQVGGLGGEGNFVLGADRLFGFTTNRQTAELPGGDAETDFDAFGLGWGLQASPFNTPRLGLDYFLTDNISLGGNLGYAEIEIDNPDGADPDSSGFIFAPRVGYMLGISEVFAFWPRGGLSYYSLDDPDRNQLALTLEALFAITPSPGFGIVTGLVADLGFAGDIELGGDDHDFRDRNLGLVFGIAGVL